MGQIKFTIIVPCYNAEKTLSRVITSLQNQTYKDFEVLIIDDGSQDGSKEIAKKITKTDLRFHVLSKINGGASSARNEGITKAKGEYICFCDSDDAILPSWLDIFDKMPSADMLSQGYICNGKVHSTESILYHKENFIDWLHSSYHAFTWGFLWCKAFKREIINKNNIIFNEQLKFQEDLEFILRFLSQCDSLSNSDKWAYIYNTGGEVNNKYNNHRRMLSSSLSICHLRKMHIKEDDILILYFQRLMIEDIFIGYRLNNDKYQAYKNLIILNKTFPNNLTKQNCIGITRRLFYYIQKYGNLKTLHFTINILCKILKQK